MNKAEARTAPAPCRWAHGLRRYESCSCEGGESIYVESGLDRKANRPIRVLCVDDSADTRRMLRDFLEAEGYEVTEAGNAHTALRLLRSERFNLLVTDHMMPDETGAWLLREAQVYGLLANVRTVMITANHQPQLLDRPANVPVFQKPLDVDRFMVVVKLLAAEGEG
jgi:CheY-like chemotaxis protein